MTVTAGYLFELSAFFALAWLSCLQHCLRLYCIFMKNLKIPGLPHYDVDVFATERSFKEWKLLACSRHTRARRALLEL
jgi:hypothetical protein